MAKNKGKYQFHQFVKASLRGTTNISPQTSTLQYIYILMTYFILHRQMFATMSTIQHFIFVIQIWKTLINGLEHDSVLAIE